MLKQSLIINSDNSWIDKPESVPQNTLNSNRIMPDIDISINGILKLLNNLKPGKAASLDSKRPILLKELRVELAPIIKVIFERSLRQVSSLQIGAKLM